MRPVTLNNVTETESRQNRPPGLLSLLTGGQAFGMQSAVTNKRN